MTKSIILNTLKENKNFLLKNFSISKIGLFGSYSTNSFHEGSDIDLVYELREGTRLGLREVYELETFFKQLFKFEKIDLINKKYLNPIIDNEVKKTVIYV